MLSIQRKNVFILQKFAPIVYGILIRKKPLRQKRLNEWAKKLHGKFLAHKMNNWQAEKENREKKLRFVKQTQT